MLLWWISRIAYPKQFRALWPTGLEIFRGGTFFCWDIFLQLWLLCLSSGGEEWEDRDKAISEYFSATRTRYTFDILLPPILGLRWWTWHMTFQEILLNFFTISWFWYLVFYLSCRWYSSVWIRIGWTKRTCCLLRDWVFSEEIRQVAILIFWRESLRSICSLQAWRPLQCQQVLLSSIDQDLHLFWDCFCSKIP